MSYYFPDPAPQQAGDTTALEAQITELKTKIDKLCIRSFWVETGSMIATWFYRPIPGNAPLTSLEFEFSHPSDNYITHFFYETDFVDGWGTNGFYTGNAIMPNDTRAYDTGKEKGLNLTLSTGKQVRIAMAFYPNNHFIVNVLSLPTGDPNWFIRNVYANGVLVT
jgi:hypothetical protein